MAIEQTRLMEDVAEIERKIKRLARAFEPELGSWGQPLIQLDPLTLDSIRHRLDWERANGARDPILVMSWQTMMDLKTMVPRADVFQTKVERIERLLDVPVCVVKIPGLFATIAYRS